jgi:hypothetical protein
MRTSLEIAVERAKNAVVEADELAAAAPNECVAAKKAVAFAYDERRVEIPREVEEERVQKIAKAEGAKKMVLAMMEQHNAQAKDKFDR